tara:strand:+ start:6691 stop:7302 length:612 start_codon:yes stop_codon:yes gene_type:complete
MSDGKDGSRELWKRIINKTSMANNIENYIIIENSNEEVLKEVKRIFTTATDECDVWTEELAKRVFGEEVPSVYDREWYETNCGSKWMYGRIEDDSDGEQHITMTSAWDTVTGFIGRLAENLRKIKSDVVVYNTFEDEGFNFSGVYFTTEHYTDTEWYEPLEDYDIEELWESDEMMEEYGDKLHQILLDHKANYDEELSYLTKS